MKRGIKTLLALSIVVCVIMSLCSCSKVDKNYGVPSEPETTSSEETSSVKPTVEKNYDYPAIMSDDEVMPKFFDISLYDEENYAQVYLGDDFEINAVYDGAEIKLPITYKEIEKLGFELVGNDKYNEKSSILAGKTVEVELQNENGSKLTAFFYNTEDSSVKLKKCNIVKLKIEENAFLSDDTAETGKFNINGINETMVLTDVVDVLGMPSHFYKESKHEYYLDYFISKEDRRNGITVWVDVEDDVITAVEFSNYSQNEE